MTGESTTAVQDPTDEDSKPVVVEEVTEDPRSELDRIDPDKSTEGDYDFRTLSDGREVHVKDLRTREFFSLLRIVTRGSTPIMGQLNLDPAQGIEAFTTQLIALITFAVPEADRETIDFINEMVEPTGEFKTKEEKAEADRDLREFLKNPELDDSFSIIEAVIRREAPDIMALGRRLVAMLPSAATQEQEKTARAKNRKKKTA